MLNRLFYCLCCVLLVGVRSQNVENIENLMDNFVRDEENLWKVINYLNNDKTRSEDVNKVLEFYGIYMGVDFGEIGIFQMISAEWLNDYNAFELIKHVGTVNNTFAQAYTLIQSNHSYIDILKFVNELPRMIVLHYSRFLLDGMGEQFWSLVQNTSQICGHNTKYVLAESQVLREVYKEILAHLLKSFILLQFTNAITATSVMDVGRIFSIEERKELRHSVHDFKKNFFEYTTESTNFSREMWACDPHGFKLMNEKDSFLEVPVSYQGFISNEMNLNSNRNCRQSCSDYTNTRQFICDTSSYCPGKDSVKKEFACLGLVQNCITMQDDGTVCVAPSNSSRRYDFIKYDDGKVVGSERNCSHKTTFVSHWDWFHKCENCLCYCNDEDISSNIGQHFSLRDVTADVDHNLIVTGVGITKVNHVFQLTILQQYLQPNGVLNTTKNQKNSNWITSPPFSITDDRTLIENEDYVSITRQNRSIALTSATIKDNGHVVTGVRFRKHNGHIGIEIRATRFDFERGILLDVDDSFWIRNSNNLNELALDKPDVPTKSPEKSRIFPENNEFIKFQPSGMAKDLAQTTVPYLDTTTVEAYVPLSGIGLYYKSTTGYGGFIAPKLITYDFGRIRYKKLRLW